MTDGYRIVDYKTWKRAVHCEVFRNHMVPQYCVSLELDITNFLEKIKKQGYSFTFAMTYAVARCANEIEEFRYRFVNGQVALYDRIDTSFTYLDRATELFKVVEVKLMDTMEEYVKAAGEAVKNQKEYFTGPPGNNVFQFSAMPWVSYTHISHTESGKKDNATPLFDWGKYFERDGKIFLPFSIQVHHSFVDGLHIGKLAETLQDYLNRYGKNHSY
ncbi:chloramphenicol acetyltransferase [Lacrimispora sp. NSJ-141]|uniref:Chloramphenicol acetyltransferase n=1 Tax=Lientehia hominis TaxID=2897778 RepID=A0AAP2RJB7_9FIRM|nr:chloramphenicol acetyltransferase [Lientehia hominis]MCD2492801.1 chloramphenicol acetyltransferase [Lientehia hominis]